MVIVHVIREPWAHHASALTAIMAFTWLVAAVWPRLAIRTFRQARWIGCYWLALSVLAETFVLGRWLGGKGWREIARAYDLMGGSSWPLVVAWIGVLPVVALMFSSGVKARDEARPDANWRHRQ